MNTNTKFVLAPAVALALSLSTLTESTLADEPTVIVNPPVVFTDIDPCTGLEHELTINETYYVHFGHRNNYVERQERSGFTDSGYTMFAGQANLVVNRQMLKLTSKDLWMHEDGRMFEVHPKWLVNLNTGETIIPFSVNPRCISVGRGIF